MVKSGVDFVVKYNERNKRMNDKIDTIVGKKQVEAFLNSAFPAKAGLKLELNQVIERGSETSYEIVMFRGEEYVGSYRLSLAAIMKLKERLINI